MKGSKGLRLGLVGAAAIAVVLIGGLVLSGQALAGGDALSISSGSAAPCRLFLLSSSCPTV